MIKGVFPSLFAALTFALYLRSIFTYFFPWKKKIENDLYCITMTINKKKTIFMPIRAFDYDLHYMQKNTMSNGLNQCSIFICIWFYCIYICTLFNQIFQKLYIFCREKNKWKFCNFSPSLCETTFSKITIFNSHNYWFIWWTIRIDIRSIFDE